MYQKLIAAAVLFVSLSGGSTVFAQGATQAVRGAAAGLQQTVEDSQKPLTAGPEDAKEKTTPGKIDPKVEREFKTTDSGLKYRILRKSEGRKKPNAASKVEVHYKGWLDNLTIFDSSYRNGKTISFGLNQVIKGWTEGVQLMSEGEMIELVIPPQLGYGARGTPGGPIPPNAQLHFIIELISFK
jgi:FKBP-type peptidyl-prolyl cis-trans isomerase